MASSGFTGDSESDGDQQSGEIKPERNLLAAVLARAICDAFGAARCEQHIIRSARRWLFGYLDVTEVFSFAWVVTHLDLDPVALQRSLRSYERKPNEIQEKLAFLR
jgi:hypothetical protein